MANDPRPPRLDWGLREDWRRVVILVLASYVIGAGFYRLSPLSPPLEVFGARQAGLPDSVGRQFTYLTAAQTRSWLARQPQAVLVDVRDREDYLRGHTTPAHSLPRHEMPAVLAAFSAQYPPSTSIILYTYSEDSPLAVQVAHELWQRGYRQLYVLYGGYEEWVRQASRLSVGQTSRLSASSGTGEPPVLPRGDH